MTSPSPSKTVHQLLGAQAGRQGLTSSCRHGSLVQATTKVCIPFYSRYLQSSPLLPAVSEIATACAPRHRSLAPHEITAAEGRAAPSYAAAERHAALPGGLVGIVRGAGAHAGMLGNKICLMFIKNREYIGECAPFAVNLATFQNSRKSLAMARMVLGTHQAFATGQQLQQCGGQDPKPFRILRSTSACRSAHLLQ